MYFQKYVKTGNDINCGQKELTGNYRSKSKRKKERNSKKKFAYVWYVSRVEYHCAALVSLKMIKNFRMGRCELPQNIYACGFFAIIMLPMSVKAHKFDHFGMKR